MERRNKREPIQGGSCSSTQSQKRTPPGLYYPSCPCDAVPCAPAFVPTPSCRAACPIVHPHPALLLLENTSGPCLLLCLCPLSPLFVPLMPDLVQGTMQLLSIPDLQGSQNSETHPCSTFPRSTATSLHTAGHSPSWDHRSSSPFIHFLPISSGPD